MSRRKFVADNSRAPASFASEQKPDDPQPGTSEMSETEVDKSLMESFPASDPPSWTLGTDHQTETRDSPAEQSEQKK